MSLSPSGVCVYEGEEEGGVVYVDVYVYMHFPLTHPPTGGKGICACVHVCMRESLVGV